MLTAFGVRPDSCMDCSPLANHQRVSSPLCAPEGQTAGLGNKETRAPSEDGLAGLGWEHQMWPNESPGGGGLTAAVIVMVAAQIH